MNKILRKALTKILYNTDIHGYASSYAGTANLWLLITKSSETTILISGAAMLGEFAALFFFLLQLCNRCCHLKGANNVIERKKIGNVRIGEIVREWGPISIVWLKKR